VQKPNWNQILLVRVRKSSGLAINISNLSSFKRVGIRIGLNLENGALIHMKRTLQTVIESCTESCIVCKRACHMQCSVACNLRLHLGFHIGTRKWEHDNTTGHWSYILWIIPYHTANSLPSTRVVVGHQHNLNMPYATRNKCHNKLLLGYQLGTSTTITVCVCVWQNSCHYIAVIVSIQFVTQSSKSLQQLQTMNGTQKHVQNNFPSDWFARFGHVTLVG
jgi:hypothetical protein